MSDGTTGEKFSHLHVHTEYSLLDGLSSPEAMVKAAVEHGFKSLAITDHGTVGGLLTFQKACKDKGIKPILGNEVYITQDHTIKEKDTKTNHLILLAKNRKGLQNLMRLTSIAETEGKYRKPRIDFPLLQKYHEGLICLTACCAGELPNKVLSGDEAGAEKFVKDYKDIFGDDFYIELMMHKYNPDNVEQEQKEKEICKKLFRLAKNMEVKSVCTNDAHYAKKSDAKYHDILLSMQTGDHIKNPDRFTFGGNEFYLKSYEEMLDPYKSAPNILFNTVEIAEKIEKDLMYFEPELLPHFSVPDGIKDEVAYLKILVSDGMKSKGLIDKPEYRERIKFEMGHIINCGFVRYFLILWDIINYSKQSGIRVGIGRGCFLPENLVDCKDKSKTIEDVRIGDKVLAYDGKYHEVVNTMSYDIEEEIVEIEMEDGRKISCTSDHKIHVNRNKELVWVRASELTEEDEVYDIRVGD